MTASQKPTEVSYLLDLYKQHTRGFVKVVGIVVAITILVSLILPHVYTAEGTIMPPDSQRSSGGLASLLQNAPISVGGELGGSNTSSALFQEILKSRTLYEGVVDTLKLDSNELFSSMEKSDIVESLMDNIDVSSKRSGMVALSIDVSTSWFPFNDSPELAAQTSAKIVNAALAELDKINKEKNVSRARQARIDIERVIVRNKLSLDSIQQALLAFQDSNKVFALDEQMEAIVENTTAIGTELAKAELELSLLSHDYSANSPQADLYRKKVASLKQQYEKAQTGGIVDVDGFSIPFKDVPKLTRDYTNLVRDQKIKEQINAYLETQRLQELIQESKDIATVVTLDPAIVPKRRTSPARTLMVISAAFLAAIGYALYLPLMLVIRGNDAKSAS